MELVNLFESLKSINYPGIYLLVDHAEKTCYINWSSNVAGALIRQLNSNKLIPEFNFELLEIVTNPLNLKPKCQFYKDKYSNMGYTLLNPNRVSNLKVSIEAIKGFRPEDSDLYLFAVKIVSGSYYNLTVGVFNEYSDMDDFLKKYYAGNLVTEIKYSNNDLTKEFLSGK